MSILTVRSLRRLVGKLLDEAHSGPVSPDNARELLKMFPTTLKKLGIDAEAVDSLEVLGTGQRGTAFDLGTDKVVKVTNDEKEAMAASMLVGKDLKNVVRFFAVWRFKDTSLYGILQEKLEPLPETEGKAFDDALIATHLPVWIYRSNYDFEKAKLLVKEFVVSQLKKNFPGNFNSPQAQEFARNVNDKWNMLIKRFGLRDMFNTLRELGIDFHDFHAGNMMRRPDGTLVLIDLGMSKIRGDSNIETVSQSATV